MRYILNKRKDVIEGHLEPVFALLREIAGQKIHGQLHISFCNGKIAHIELKAGIPYGKLSEESITILNTHNFKKS